MFADKGRPSNVILASAVGVVGGIVSLASMVNGYDAESDSLFWCVGLGLLITVLFFASAGFLYPNSKGNFASLMAICVINAAAIITGLALGVIGTGFGIALIVLEAVFIILISIGKTGQWMEFDRA